jgi:hypothetical protein
MLNEFEPPLNTIRLASKLLRHLSLGLNSAKHEVEVRLLIPALSDLLQKDQVVDETLINLLAALVALTDDEYDQVNSTAVLECPGLLPRLLALLKPSPLLEQQQFALGVVANLCAASTPEQMQQIREKSLNILKMYVGHSHPDLAHAACRCLVDHCALSDGLADVMGAGFIPIVMGVAHKCQDDSFVHRVTSYVFVTALTTATLTQTLVLIQTGCWAHLARLFVAPKFNEGEEVVDLVCAAIQCVGKVMSRFDSVADFDLAYDAMKHLVDGWMFLHAFKTSACAEVRECAGELDMTMLRARLTGDEDAPMVEQKAVGDEQHQEVV